MILEFWFVYLTMSTPNKYNKKNYSAGRGSAGSIKINKNASFSKGGLNKKVLNSANDMYDGCKITKDIMSDICKKLGIQPEVLYEELYYQLPLEWIRPLRNELYRKMALEIKNDNIHKYLTESSDGSYTSDNSSNY